MTIFIATKQASEIAIKAQELSNSLRDIALQDNVHIASGIDQFVFSVTIFVLACFVGYYVVWKVTPALHTPLMSITNAISGVIVIGGMIAASTIDFSISSVCGYFAVFLASINVFGGFIVTERMIEMFKKK